MKYDEMKRFCATSPDRMVISEPFQVGHWICATDGRLLIRKPRSIDKPGKWMDGGAIDKKLRKCGDPRAPKEVECVMPVRWKSDKLRDPTGMQIPEPKNLTRCPECSTYRCCAAKPVPTEDDESSLPERCDCTRCEGLGWLNLDMQPLLLLGYPFNAVYIRKISTLPGARFQIAWQAGQASDYKAMLGIKFDGGGEGALMPMRWVEGMLMPEQCFNLTPECPAITY